jgi:hypothetical protein
LTDEVLVSLIEQPTKTPEVKEPMTNDQQSNRAGRVKEPMTNNQNTNRAGQRKKLLRFIDGRSAAELDLTTNEDSRG